MADKQARALARLLKKLSALRMTLGKDERDILDQLVLGAKAQVGGHRLMSQAAPKPSTKPSGRIARRAEVGGHALTASITPKPSTKPSERIILQAKIIFDTASKTYKVSE